jgi:hypothetical protein
MPYEICTLKRKYTNYKKFFNENKNWN